MEAQQQGSSIHFDYYEILGVQRGAEMGDINECFRRKTQDGTITEYEEEAYEILSDPEIREIHDAHGHLQDLTTYVHGYRPNKCNVFSDFGVSSSFFVDGDALLVHR